MNLLGIPVQRSPLLFCLFSKGMSEAALSPLLINLLPLVYVTDGDLGPHHPWSTSTPSDSPTNRSSTESSLFICVFAVYHFSLFLVKCLCVIMCESEWAWAKSKFTYLTQTMLMFGSKARTWPYQFTSLQACGEEREDRWPTGTRQWHSLVWTLGWWVNET